MSLSRSAVCMIILGTVVILCLVQPVAVHSDVRAISVIADLSHQSGKIGTYRALIIGIGDYEDARIPDLQTPTNDARAMAELLKSRYGFVVETLLDRKATKRAIYGALRNLSAKAEPNDSILIYFAGHGELDKQYDDGWWIPVDASAGDPVTYLDNGQVQKAMRSMDARHVLLVSDSCYSGTLFGQARALPPLITDNYYLNLYNEKSRWGLTSGNRTPVSDSGTGGHSIFAYQLIKELTRNEKPFLSTQEIYAAIAPIVGNNSEQVPMCRPIRNTGDQGGEFVFIATHPAAPAREESAAPATRLDTPPSAMGRLYINPTPPEARVRILNIKPVFRQGMELAAGRYKLEITAGGHEGQSLWVALKPGEEKRLDVQLQSIAAGPAPKAAATLTAKAEAPPQAHGLEGAWKGTGIQDESTTWNVIITIGPKGSTVEYPFNGCNGTLQVIEAGPDRMLFLEKIEKGWTRCINNGKMEIKRVDSKRATFKWYYADGSEGAEGSLTRVGP